MALGSNIGMGFLRINLFAVIQNGEFQFGLKTLDFGKKKVVYGGLQAKNKMKKNKKKNSLKHWSIGLMS